MSDWRPSAEWEPFAARAKLLAIIRKFFEDRGVMEVETPVLSSTGNSDPGITQFKTTASLYLRTSPEYPMKRLLAAGSGDIFEMGRVFRQDESGPRHNPEFTLLEWYRVGWTWQDLAREVVDLIQTCGASFNGSWTHQDAIYAETFAAATNLDPHLASREELSKAARRLGLEIDGEMSRNDWLDLLMSHAVQPTMPGDSLVILGGYPASQAALARIRPGTPPIAERFECFLGGVELANGYQELTDPEEQRQRFEEENRHRKASGQDPIHLDERLLAAMEHGLPECSGVALGVDRLLMACLDADHLGQVLAFPSNRA